MEDRQAVHPRISAYTWLLLLAVASAAGERTEAGPTRLLMSFDGSLTDFSFYTLPVRGILSGYPCVWVYVILYLSLSRFMNTL